MARSFLVLDIETIPDPELVWDAAVDGFPPPPFHQVVALGVLWLDGDHSLRKLGAFGGEEDAPPVEDPADPAAAAESGCGCRACAAASPSV